MAQRPQPDPRTLEEVHRLLESTEFASIEELAGRADLSAGVRAVAAPQPEVVAEAEAADAGPLPKRR